MGYTKLFSEIVTSTIWQEPDHVRILWITLLALRESNHVVNASIPGLAHTARIKLEQCEEAIRILESPDPYSRTKEFEGRRIKRVDGGFLILNGDKYRRKMSVEERREYQKTWARNKRMISMNVDTKSTNSIQSETETETKKEYDDFFVSNCESESAHDWNVALNFARSEGRYSNKPLPLTDKGKKAVQAIGGFSAICDSNDFNRNRLKQEFMEAWGKN